MTSIMSLLSSPYMHFTPLSSLYCHPLRLPVSNLHQSVYTSIISSFSPFSSISRLIKLTCCRPHPPSARICPRLPSSSPVFSVPFCCHYRRHHSHSAVPACLSSHQLSAFLLVWEAFWRDPTPWRPSVSRSDRAECGCNTGSCRWL